MKKKRKNLAKHIETCNEFSDDLKTLCYLLLAKEIVDYYGMYILFIKYVMTGFVLIL